MARKRNVALSIKQALREQAVHAFMNTGGLDVPGVGRFPMSTQWPEPDGSMTIRIQTEDGLGLYKVQVTGSMQRKGVWH